MDFEDDPGPPYPESTFKKIGEFFYMFSIIEEWICNYLKIHGGYNHDFVLGLSLDGRIKTWTKIACQNEPYNSQINAFALLLNEIKDYRNAVAHAWWREYNEQLHGRFVRKRDKKVITIDGDAHLDKIIAKAKHCTVIIDFW